jgi:hypothetical protein
MNQKKFNQTFTQVLSKFKNQGRIHATLGAPNGDLYYYDLSGNIVPDLIWASLSDTSVRAVRNKHVLVQSGLHVVLEYASDGVLEVIEEDSSLSRPFSGNRNFNIPNHAWAHGLFGPDALYIDGLQLKPLQPHPNFPSDMNLVVSEYSYYFGGSNQYLAETLIDLSSYFAAIGGGAQNFVVIAIDPATATINVYNGFGATPFVPSIYSVPFTPGDVATIDCGTDKRICAVRLYSGQTQITWADIFLDLRNSAGFTETADVSDLNSLSDTVIASPAQGDVLTRGASNWFNQSIGTNEVVMRAGSGNVDGLAMSASTILARLASGDIIAATISQIKTLLAITNSDLPSPVLFDHYADVGNSGTSETDLYGDTIAANTLAADGDKLKAFYAGITVASATATRQIRAYFAGTLIYDSGALSFGSSGDWLVEINIIRSSSTSVRCVVSFSTTGATISAYTNVIVLTGLTLSATNILKITGQAAGVGAATNDIVAQLGSIRKESAA